MQREIRPRVDGQVRLTAGSSAPCSVGARMLGVGLIQRLCGGRSLIGLPLAFNSLGGILCSDYSLRTSSLSFSSL
jgi:hypothetical protein